MKEEWIVSTSGRASAMRCTLLLMAGFIVTPTKPMPGTAMTAVTSVMTPTATNPARRPHCSPTRVETGRISATSGSLAARPVRVFTVKQPDPYPARRFSIPPSTMTPRSRRTRSTAPEPSSSSTAT